MAVYFASVIGDARFVKIGFTTDLDTRISNLNVSSPFGIEILAVMDGGRETEEYLQAIKFAHLHHRGEWFLAEEELLSFIAKVKSGNVPRLPMSDATSGFRMATCDYSERAIAQAKIMAHELIDNEYRGVGDTIQAAMDRCQTKTGFPASWLFRLRYRDTLSDVPAGIYFHLASVWGKDVADLVAGKEGEAAE